MCEPDEALVDVGTHLAGQRNIVEEFGGISRRRGHRKRKTLQTRRIAIAIFLLLGLFAPRVATAQWTAHEELLSLPSPEARWGLLAGGFRFFPRLFVEGRYDSNVFREDASESPLAAPILRVMPGITIGNPASRVLRMQFDADGDFRFYFADDDVSDGQRDMGVRAALDLNLFPDGPFELYVYDKFLRAIQTRNWDTIRSFNRNTNEAGIKLLFRPGGGALQLGLGYAYVLDLFDEFSSGDQTYHRVGAHVAWRFFPLTVAYLDADFRIVDYDEAFGNPALGLENTSSMPLRVVVGLNGNITKRLALLVEAGWAHGFYEDGPSFSGPLGRARVSYRFTETTLAQLGYAHSFEDSLYANFYSEHRVFANVQQALWGRLRLAADFAYHYVTFASFEPAAGSDVSVTEKRRADHGLIFGFTATIDVTRWLGFRLGYEFEKVLSDFEVSVAGVTRDVVTYDRHQVFGSVVVRY